MRIAYAGIHRGEEPPISVVSGRFTGSGTIFFSGCTLGCGFCQNYQISHAGLGRAVDVEEFAEMCIRLEKSGAANINLITGTHFIPSIRLGLEMAREQGLGIPVLWNTSSFESGSGLDVLLPVVDIFLADLKTLEPAGSRWFRGFSAYPSVAEAALLRMAQARPVLWGGEGELLGGCVVRYLVMPGEAAAAEAVLRWFSEALGDRAILSLMVQFVDVRGKRFGDGPGGDAGLGGDAVLGGDVGAGRDAGLGGDVGAGRDAGLGGDVGAGRDAGSASISRRDYRRLLDMLDRFGIDDGFIQELDPGAESGWIPDFSRINPFPESFSDPVWHWREGFVR
jgi:putative pyruvate formate lyase activating enzyme